MLNKLKLLEELHEIARKYGGRCLSNEYVNSKEKLLFECKHGHQFESCRNYLKAGNWCPFCIGRGKTIADLQELATQQGGRCLSPNFLGMGKKHLWECAEGHTWEAIPQNIKTLGRWCPVCGRAKSDRNRRRYTLEDMLSLAQSRGGLCLSSHFESVIKKLTWQCKEGHIWKANPHHIKNGNWCPVCAQKSRSEKRKTHTIEQMQAFAVSKAGRCLSQVFVNVKENLLWECSEGHQWKANADNIVNGGKWCPICAGNREKTLEDMQKLAAERGGQCLSTTYQGVNKKLLWECQEGHSWETIPSVLIRGGWCPECSIGLGERICRAFFEQLFGFSFNKARPEWLRTSDGYQMELDGYSPLLKIAFEHQGLQHYKHIKYFHTSDTSLLWECEVGHQWQARPSNVLFGTWCPECAKKERGLKRRTHTIEEMHEIAADRNGKCLSSSYQGTKHKLLWECKKGHRWESTPESIFRGGSWCPICAKRSPYKSLF